MSMPVSRADDDRDAIEHPGFEADAGLIAENVMLAIARVRGEEPFSPQDRTHAVATLMRALLATMPAGSGQVLTDACNRALAVLPVRERPLPWVESVEITDGSVTLRVP